MTNKSNSNNQPESECIPCKAFSYFETLAKTTDIEEAFHDALDFAIESIIEDLVDAIGQKSFEDGFDVGYASAYKAIAEEMMETAEILNEELNYPCDTCDCETDDECKVDTETAEDKIRNAIRED